MDDRLADSDLKVHLKTSSSPLQSKAQNIPITDDGDFIKDTCAIEILILLCNELRDVATCTFKSLAT